MITLYSIQSLRSFACLLSDGQLRGLWHKVDPDFADPYKWMIKMMTQKIGPPLEDRPPVWAWFKYDVQHKPDLKYPGHAESGTKLVMLTLEVHESRVLLSDFIAWHAVLNNTPLVQGEDKEKSWEKIFDLPEACKIIEQSEEDQTVQATLWKIQRQDVKHIKFFTAA